jgi:hypothetical protein
MRAIRKGFYGYFLCATAAVLLLALAACQPGAAPAEPTEADLPEAGQTQPVDEKGYPTPVEPEDGVLPTASYPAPGEDGPVGPGQVPARPNASRVTAELIEVTPYAENPEYTRLRVRLLSSQAMEGMASVTDELVDQEMELLVKTSQLPDLQPGETFEAEVSFMGDEHGSNYYILNLLKMPD